MRLISALSVTDITNTIWSGVHFISCIRGTATHSSHGLDISLYARYLETKLEGIRYLNPDRSFKFFPLFDSGVRGGERRECWKYEFQ